jgi:peptidyl-tRNA hydrolase, PTH1 family
MKILVALGNPGVRYEVTRHNVGWLLLDYCLDEWGISASTQKNQAEVYQMKWKGEPVLCVKPQTFMNLSGRAVAPLAQFYKCAPEDIIVLHDELDIAPLQFKIKKGGGHAGHNGLKSLEAEMGTREYYRFRLGIGHPRTVGSPMDVADYVLGRFSQQECDDWVPIFKRAKSAIELMLEGQVLKAMNQFNVTAT